MPFRKSNAWHCHFHSLSNHHFPYWHIFDIQRIPKVGLHTLKCCILDYNICLGHRCYPGWSSLPQNIEVWRHYYGSNHRGTHRTHYRNICLPPEQLCLLGHHWRLHTRILNLQQLLPKQHPYLHYIFHRILLRDPRHCLIPRRFSK